ncbi:MAG: hypothetical protein JST85_03890 [Acidobacteria bacterium]|nr:hypothetical protein [Acidobacteriota bacterium]
MGALFTLLVGLLSIGSVVCWIMVLIKMFQAEGPLHGILGIICGIYALIWGWMHADEHNLRKIVQIWTACVVLSLLLNFMIVPMMSR